MSGEQAFLAAAKRLASRMPTIDLTVRAGSVFCIISVMQLALRHPEFQGPIRDQARALVDLLIAQVEAEEPELGPLLRQGFDPRFDVPR